MKVIEEALKQGRTKLSEYESKQVLGHYKIPITREMQVDTSSDLLKAAQDIGYPLVLKGCSPEIAHKTEKNLIRVDIRNDDEATFAFNEIMAGMKGSQGTVLVQEMVKGQRELALGLIRDPQFGPCVMFGLGGVFTEVLQDVAFRVAPLSRRDAMEMMDDIKARKILQTFRGKPAVDRESLADILINVGRMGLEQDRISEIDINPLKVPGGKPVAVDALVVLEGGRD